MMCQGKFLAFFCLIIIINTVNCQICPVADDIKPCTCKEDPMPATTTCYNIKDNTLIQNGSMLMNIFERSLDYPMINFVLRDSNLMYIPASSMKTKKFEYIKVENTTMSSLFDEPPASPNNLKELFLVRGTKVQKAINWQFFAPLDKLERLEITQIKVSKLGKDFMDNISKVINHLEISSAEMNSLDDEAFARLILLDWLYLRNNRIQTVKRSMFSNPSVIWLMNFSENRLETLPDDLFTNMPELHSVYLDNNRFSTFSENVFGDVYKRTKLSSYVYERRKLSLYMSGNPLVCDCNIKWFVKVLKSNDTYGSCAQPPSKKGKDLKKLTEEDFSYCNRN